MGTRGPVKKRAAIRLIEGNRSHRKLPKAKPQPPAVLRAGAPEVPKGMSPRGRRIWLRLVDALLDAGCIHAVDERAIWQLAEDEGMLEEAYWGMRKMRRGIFKAAKKAKRKLKAGSLIAMFSDPENRKLMLNIRELSNRVIAQRKEMRRAIEAALAETPPGVTPTNTPLKGIGAVLESLERKITGVAS